MKEKLYSGKAKDVYASDKDNEVVIYFKDSATAGNGAKKAEIDGKGALNNKITVAIFEHLISKGIKTHFIKQIDDRSQLCQKIDIIPLEVIIRNIAAGSFARNFGREEGEKLLIPTFEVSYKKDELGDPLMCEDHAIALGIVSSKEYEAIKKEAHRINVILSELFLKMGIKLVDFKLEFGKNSKGEIVLADEFSPDNCRLWDAKTNKKLDKDNFRQDIGSLTDAYQIVWERLCNVL